MSATIVPRSDQGKSDAGATFAPRYGVDLITFYHGDFWGVTDLDELTRRAADEPRWFWDRVLESAQAAGITGIELTFPPGDWRSALSAYGSIDGFVAALRTHGLELIGCFFSELEHVHDVTSPAEQQAVIDAGVETARFVRQGGGELLVVGMPVLRDHGFVDLDYAKSVADLINRLGAATRQEGVGVALHTEMGSAFCRRRDIDLFMLLTDPGYVGLCPDTAHITMAGGDPLEVLNAHHERVVVTHWKDVMGPVTSEPRAGENVFAFYGQFFRRVGTGGVDWFAWARRLRDLGYRGWTILELDEAGEAVNEVTAARAYVDMVVGAL
jgi:sugar phosphate isomerase/epimerase